MLASWVMSKRRTLQEKIAAAKNVGVVAISRHGEGEETANWLRTDLTRAIVVTILAVTVQVILAYYLNHGGWKFILEGR